MSSSATTTTTTTPIRHDWYQTDEKVVITVLIKNVREHNVDIQPERVVLTADDFTLALPLFKPIVVDRSTYRISPVKIEITLAKEVGTRWSTLTFDAAAASVATIPTATTTVPIDKVANIYKHDWDQLEKQIEKEEADKKEVRNTVTTIIFCSFVIFFFVQGDALTNLFQQIYSSSNEEVRRAMNKSFSESGGTVLSTNWQEVGEKQVEVKPPDGTEFKKWH